MINQQNSVSNSLQQFQKLWDWISSINKVISMVNKELETIKISINEINLSELEGSLKQYTSNAVGSIQICPTILLGVMFIILHKYNQYLERRS
jgi:hypothetical protein